jgi:hypothetical protein
VFKISCGAGCASTGLGEIYFVVLGREPTNFGVFEMKSTAVDAMGVLIVTVVDKIVPGVVISSAAVSVGVSDAAAMTWGRSDDEVSKMVGGGSV